MPDHLVHQTLAKPYARVITPDSAGGYAAQVLEFPGCFSDGDTPEEAYRNLEEAAENWVDAALAQGMAIPEPFVSQGYSGTISLRLPKSIHRRAAEYAHKDGVSLNQFLLSAIAARVGAEDLLSAIASKLDDRLDRLERGRTSKRLMCLEYESEEGATTSEVSAAARLDEPAWIVPRLFGHAGTRAILASMNNLPAGKGEN